MNLKISTLFVFCIALILHHQMLAQHNFELYNDGALVHVQAGAEVHVWGDVHNYQATGDLQNNGLIKVQGNMYSDALFQQSGTGTTLLENSDVNTTENQFISGSYAVRTGNPSDIGVNDGSFYNLELANSQGIVYLDNTAAGANPQFVADVRNSVNFNAGSVVNNLVTANVGLNVPTYPANGAAYAAEFGMMNNAAGLGNFIGNNASLNGNMSATDQGYVVGKLRRAINDAVGGIYQYPVGLEPAAINAQRGFQYIHLNLDAGGNYNVIRSYFQTGSPNNAAVATECSGYQMDDFWGNRHGEWVFDDFTGSGTGNYEVKVWPQDPSVPFNGTVWTISKDDVFEYPAPDPLHNDCGPTSVGLDRGPFNGFSEFGLVSSVILLESEIINLEANAINNKFIKVDWSTSKEVDVDHFVIERSTDDANFSPITTHTAVGNSLIPQNYFIDDYAVLANINYYYRVKVVHVDGSVKYTHSVVAALVNDGSVETVNLFPNPIAEGEATIEITSTTENSTSILVYDAIGQLICSKIVAVQKGLNTFTIDTDDWPSAVYYVRISNDKSSTIKELIKSDK